MLQTELPMNRTGKSIGDLKQALSREYNQVNKHLFDAGVRKQQVDCIGNKIVFTTLHKRVYAMRTIDGRNRDLTRTLDVMLIDEFKQHLRKHFTATFGFSIVSIFKDYDPHTELAVTVIILEEDVEVYL
ncbi:Na-translocating system protein MpsC family protein [Aneurinibacillus aneurinilyticus]|nr:Na-translocating system protein MpsC family protein [Aneurinibacillus aneurinilyticus]MCI1696077.1 Na-translocating system protein MpsC family protein [Aneurinibacillus aneurinilyticus]MED0706241.1 Na-translocating system protein MpsC family protein [Aneurinibacillus aneurinilyticus]MED0724195.1 Na-translocating system protein MpsC family protein [Aneurinibacillus aneurinilyticus]MED0732239.1 Na-translocating system protein MpsC family protein [Aneurinibacillus aneurinilyticus]MED0741744.1 